MALTTIVGIAGIVLSLAAYLWMARADNRLADNARQFFFYDWSLSGRSVAATIFASGMSLATVVIALLQLGCLFGVALSWATITYCLGWVVLVLVVRTLRSRLEPTETLHGFLGRVYGSRTVTRIASAATVVGFVGTFSTELIAGGVVFEALGLSRETATWGVIAFGLVAILYSSVGGFRAVIRSDRIQAALILPMLLGLTILAVAYWQQSNGPPFFDSPLSRSYFLPLSVAVNIALINILFPLVDMSAWQRIAAASSSSAFNRGAWWAIAGFFVTWTTLICLAVLVGPVIPSGADPFIEVVRTIESLPTALGALLSLLIFPGLVAAMLSTADTFLNAAGHTYSLDLCQVDPANVTSLRKVRLHIFVLGSIGFGAALTLRWLGFGVVDMIFAVYGGTLALFFPVLLALCCRPGTLLRKFSGAAFTSILLGLLAAWANGFYSTLAPKGEFWSRLHSYIPFDVYRSPGYAFAVSGMVFLCIVLLTKACRRVFTGGTP